MTSYTSILALGYAIVILAILICLKNIISIVYTLSIRYRNGKLMERLYKQLSKHDTKYIPYCTYHISSKNDSDSFGFMSFILRYRLLCALLSMTGITDIDSIDDLDKRCLTHSLYTCLIYANLHKQAINEAKHLDTVV